jgi:hypothetical protein
MKFNKTGWAECRLILEDNAVTIKVWEEGKGIEMSMSADCFYFQNSFPEYNLGIFFEFLEEASGALLYKLTGKIND